MRQEHLRAVDFPQQQRLPRRVQVCQDVIEEHNWPLAELLPQQVHFGQAQAQRHGMMLPARPEGSRVDAV